MADPRQDLRWFRDGHPGHGLNELAPAFFSDCDDLVEAASAAGVAAWIFGHHHWSLATETRGVRLLSAQLGYPGEDTGWTGPGYLELSRFLMPPAIADHRSAPVNALGYLRVMFAVDDIDETLDRLRKRGAQLVGEVVQYKDAYRLCYIRGPEGLLIGLAQELS